MDRGIAASMPTFSSAGVLERCVIDKLIRKRLQRTVYEQHQDLKPNCPQELDDSQSPQGVLLAALVTDGHRWHDLAVVYRRGAYKPLARSSLYSVSAYDELKFMRRCVEDSALALQSRGHSLLWVIFQQMGWGASISSGIIPRWIPPCPKFRHR